MFIHHVVFRVSKLDKICMITDSDVQDGAMEVDGKAVVAVG